MIAFLLTIYFLASMLNAAAQEFLLNQCDQPEAALVRRCRQN